MRKKETLERLLKLKKYRRFGVEKLGLVIGNELSFSDYNKLDGHMADDKAVILKAKWKIESVK